ncbi:hypothetical protein [Streptomyces sp. NPDC006879]|uniref:hypothetical protein n=1 Tax=Streptomyces sp. NPDC006879 TaxID=3364767 RepID=UPI0036BF4DC9
MSGQGRRIALVSVAVLVLAGGGGLAGWLLAGAGEHGAPTAGPSLDVGKNAAAPSAVETFASPEEERSPSAPAAPTTSPTASPEASVPPDYALRTDTAGFQLLTPVGWLRWTERQSVFYGTPSRDTALQVFTLEEPTPATSMRLAVDLAKDRQGYRQIALDLSGAGPRGAVLHEYTFAGQEFGPQRVIDQRFTAEDGTRYSVLVRGPAQPRSELVEVHHNAVERFCVSGFCAGDL